MNQELTIKEQKEEISKLKKDNEKKTLMLSSDNLILKRENEKKNELVADIKDKLLAQKDVEIYNLKEQMGQMRVQ